MSTNPDSVVGDVRQCGVMVGIELVADKATGRPFDPKARVGAAVCRRVRDRGVIVRPLGDTIVLNPPLVSTVEHWRAALDAVEAEIALPGRESGVLERGEAVVAGDF